MFVFHRSPPKRLHRFATNFECIYEHAPRFYENTIFISASTKSGVDFRNLTQCNQQCLQCSEKNEYYMEYAVYSVKLRKKKVCWPRTR